MFLDENRLKNRFVGIKKPRFFNHLCYGQILKRVMTHRLPLQTLCVLFLLLLKKFRHIFLGS